MGRWRHLEKTAGNVDAAIELLTTQLDEPSMHNAGVHLQPGSPGRVAWGDGGVAVRSPKDDKSQAKADLLPQEQAALLLERMRRNGWGQSGEEELDEEGVETADEQGEANHANHDGVPSLQDGAQIVVVEKKFDGMDDRQLSLAVGDQVELVSRDPSGWTYGRLIGGDRDGAEGWFPHYVGRAARMKPKPQFPPPPLESPPENETKRENPVASVAAHGAVAPIVVCGRGEELGRVGSDDLSDWLSASSADDGDDGDHGEHGDDGDHGDDG